MLPNPAPCWPYSPRYQVGTHGPRLQACPNRLHYQDCPYGLRPGLPPWIQTTGQLHQVQPPQIKVQALSLSQEQVSSCGPRLQAYLHRSSHQAKSSERQHQASPYGHRQAYCTDPINKPIPVAPGTRSDTMDPSFRPVPAVSGTRPTHLLNQPPGQPA